MLFSNDEIASFINENFEPCWKSVRDVPTVSIDFGNGKKLKRTLHGNIATYVCNKNGKVIDVLPGVYDPIAYKNQLSDLKLASEYVSPHGEISESLLLKYHKVRLETIKSGAEFSIKWQEVGRETIKGVETSLEIVLNPKERLAYRGGRDRDVSKRHAVGGNAGGGVWGSTGNGIADYSGMGGGMGGGAPNVADEEKADELLSLARFVGNTKPQEQNKIETLNDRLETDTRINETERRLEIHNYILRKGLTTPSDMHKWLYREVLHADLDDPYMGLGKVLFHNYPFQKEDEVAKSVRKQ